MPNTRPNALTGERMGFGTMVWRFSALMALAAAFVGLSAGRATAGPVTCGDVLTHSAKLQSDLNCSGDGIIIGADRITLNLNGHTLQGARGIGIENNGHGRVDILNGRILGFERGIRLAGADNNTLAHLEIDPEASQDERNRVGLVLSDSWSNVIHDSSIDAGDPGVFVRASSKRNRFLRSQIFGGVGALQSAGDAMVLEGGSNANRIVESTVEGGGFGLRVNSSARNVLFRNVISGEHNPMLISGAVGMVIKGNNAVSSGPTIAGTANSQIDHNTFGSGMTVTGDQNYIGYNRVDAGDITVAEISGDENLVEFNRIGASFSGAPALELFGGNATVLRYNSLFGGQGGSDGIKVGTALTPLPTNTRVVGNTADAFGENGIEVTAPGTFIGWNTARNNGDLGIEAVSGVTDGGGNHASGNGNPLQCVNVRCSP